MADAFLYNSVSQPGRHDSQGGHEVFWGGVVGHLICAVALLNNFFLDLSEQDIKVNVYSYV